MTDNKVVPFTRRPKDAAAVAADERTQDFIAKLKEAAASMRAVQNELLDIKARLEAQRQDG